MRVVVEKKAGKDLESQDTATRQRIKEALTDLTDEEKKWIQEGRKRYREHPEEFTPLESLKL